jgi:hypothetical protein
MKNRLTPLGPLLFLSFILMIAFKLGTNILARWNADYYVLVYGNFILVVITIISFLVISRSAGTANNQAFIRSIYISFILKFFLIIATVFLYATLTKELNKSALFICAIIYLVYNFIEVAALTKLVKQKKNA